MPDSSGADGQVTAVQLSDRHVSELQRLLDDQQSAVKQLLAQWTEKFEEQQKNVVGWAGVPGAIVTTEIAPDVGTPRPTSRQSPKSARAANRDKLKCASDDELLIKQGNADSEIDIGNKKSEASRFVPQAQRHTHTSNPGTSSQDSAASAHTRAVTARSQFNGRSGTSNSDNDADERDAAVEKLTTALEDFRKSINVKLDAWGIRTQEKMMQRTFLGRFVCSPAFKLMVSVVILVNAITFGVEVDQKLTNPDYKEENWRVLEVFFVVFFSLELLLRAFAERTAFVSGKERW